MSYRRFYAPPEGRHGDTVALGPEESHHLIRVLRLQPGDIIDVFDGLGREYRCCVESVKAPVRARILEALGPRGESPLWVTLIQSLTKADKFDLIVQKATELGVARIIPVISERTEIRWAEEKAQARVARWQKIALEAAKQCRRSRAPEVQPVCALAEALTPFATLSRALRLCLSEREGVDGKAALPAQAPSEAIIVVGPEGGWSDADLIAAVHHGFSPVTLGTRILRTETAALVALSILQFRFGDF